MYAVQHVGVKANVVDVRTGTEQLTNDFRFTWCREKGEEPLKRMVVPMTYQGASLQCTLHLGALTLGVEAMWWVEGRAWTGFPTPRSMPCSRPTERTFGKLGCNIVMPALSATYVRRVRVLPCLALK